MAQVAIIANENISSFELNKMITTSRFFSKIKLTPSAKLVLRCLIDFWNPQKGKVFPKQSTIADCTGITRNSVVHSIEELRNKGLILTIKSDNKLNYHFSNLFFESVGLKDKNNSLELCKNITHPSKNFLHHGTNNNKQIKNKKEISFKEKDSTGINQTKLLLEKYRQAKENRKSPYDDYSCAINFLENLDSRSLKLKCIQDTVIKISAIWKINPENFIQKDTEKASG